VLAFKVLGKLGINAFQSIVFNYIFCVITGSVMNRSLPFQTSWYAEPWMPWAVGMGFAFIFLFNIISVTARHKGVSTASVSNKLSMVIPVVFSGILYGETIGAVKIAGIILALVAVIFTAQPSDEIDDGKHKVHKWYAFLPLILFVGSGLLDTSIKYVEQAFLNEANHHQFIITAFGVAAFTGMVIYSWHLVTGREKFEWKAVVAGMLIGIPNYFSIWFLVQVLKTYGDRSATMIPVNNMSIVLVSAVTAWLFLGERITARNWFGIGMAIVAIAMIAFGK
jgi:drug/metabolite transporter (DMT)-like permease